MPIDEPIDTAEQSKDDMEKRKPKPFRYVTDEHNAEDNPTMEEEAPFTVMKTEKRSAIFNTGNPAILGNAENAEMIEDIIKKHRETRKSDEE
ncbi:MAG: hypothetical protein U9R21_06815 [Candidatus Thermoplasmatota archaeon]|nr:hypothetical protein [Candidatus Thermoplasmatota archaeon]